MIRFVLFLLIIYFVYAFYKAIRKNTREPKIKDIGKANVVNVAPCPDPKTFLNYIEGRIDGKQKEAMRKHIDNCQDCMYALQAAFDMPAKEELKK